MGPPPRDRRALVDAIGDLVAEALDARSEPDGIENIVRECPSDCSCNTTRAFNAATYIVLGEKDLS